MTALVEPEMWMDHAACTGTDPDLFFPEGPIDYVLVQIEIAKAVCAICPVRHECLVYALHHKTRHGVWGGIDLDPEHRRIRNKIAV